MSSRTPAWILIGMIIGGSIGYGGAFKVFTPQINEITTSFNDITSNYETLLEEHESALNEYEDLMDEHEELNLQFNNLIEEKSNLDKQYKELSDNYVILEDERDNLLTLYSVIQNNYDSLEENYNDLEFDYETTFGYLSDLTRDVKNFNELLYTYCVIPECFERVLNNIEVNKINEKVSDVTKNTQEYWTAYERIYYYINNNINYVSDVEFPYISYNRYITIEGQEVNKGFNTDSILNYIQTPDFTIEYEQGDCDDQAVLVYAMIKNYERNIYGSEFRLFFACLEFKDGVAHACVFLPVEGGHLCIIDPAGHYLTSRYGGIASKIASTELKSYLDKWSYDRVDIFCCQTGEQINWSRGVNITNADMIHFQGINGQSYEIMLIIPEKKINMISVLIPAFFLLLLGLYIYISHKRREK